MNKKQVSPEVMELFMLMQSEGTIEKIINRKELWTVKDLARYLKVSQRTIYRWLEHDRIPYHEVACQKRFDPQEVEVLLRKGVFR